MSISAADVKKLRDMTGAGMMDAKKALSENNGDFDNAVKYLREKGLADSKKRADKEANQGTIGDYIHFQQDRAVAGVVSTNPAHLMNSDLQGDTVVALALQGRVPCKILGKVDKGDLIVTSAIPGYGIVDNNPVVGTVIGKAIGTKDDDGKGVVEVLVGRV